MNPRAQQVIALAQKGVPPREIAGIENIDQGKIYNILRAARAKGVDVPYFARRPKRGAQDNACTEVGQQIVLGPGLFRLLDHAARRRDISPGELARELLERSLLTSAVRHD